MSSVDEGSGKRREDRPVVRRRFVARAKTLLSDPTFHRIIPEVRSGWNEAYPSFALPHLKWGAESLAFNAKLICLPPGIEDAIRTATAGREEPPDSVRVESNRWGDILRNYARLRHVPDSVRDASIHWDSIVLSLCHDFWPPVFYPNWLGYPMHPASLFVSACLICDLKSVDPDHLITFGNLRPRPIPFDPFDQWGSPGAFYWRTYANVLAEAIEVAIARGEVLTEKWRDELKMSAYEASAKAHDDRLAASPADLYWVFAPFPGLTGTDRDDLMAEMLDAITTRHGAVDPIRGQARALSDNGMNPNQIAKLLGVDRKTVVGWLKAA